MIGIDLIEISRIERVIERWGDKFLERIFTEKELKKNNVKSPIEEIAARFAGKEAVSKALGTGLQLMGSKGKVGVSWKEIEIFNRDSGKPFVILSGRAAAVSKELGFKEIHVGLTHIRNLAQAVAFAEKV